MSFINYIKEEKTVIIKSTAVSYLINELKKEGIK